MIVENLKWLWKVSAICQRHEAGGQSLNFREVRALKRRFSYLARAAQLLDSLQVFMHPQEGTPLRRAMEQRPELVGVVMWPYICSSWSARTCLHRIDQHFKVLEKAISLLDFPFNESLVLLDLDAIASKLRVVIDQPKWFMREGMLVINLFERDTRIYSLAFSFAFEDDKVVAYVGAIQGVDTDGILDSYKELTKSLHGMRPRDFLVELFRIFCRSMKIAKIYAVNDAKRHHRSRYFGADKNGILRLNYDDIWLERGGERDSEDFFILSVEANQKSLETIPSKKRAMYRRRYELLQSLEERMQANINEIAKSKAPAPAACAYSLAYE